MSSGERPIGAAKGRQPDAEALCQPPSPPLLSNERLVQRALLFGPYFLRALLFAGHGAGGGVWTNSPPLHFRIRRGMSGCGWNSPKPPVKCVIPEVAPAHFS